ncbi:MAG: tRNA 2-thiouridine(34) synthase MnmA, partial [Armatimonadetes bacterium]|nr:tRNA 2-thiouridine(34) synthase MnmA [Candidatus Hippobium faecium]
DINLSKKKDRQIAVLMSGGVDSSVTALLLKEQGYEVLGITMKLPLAGSEEKSCNGNDGAKVAYELNIPHYIINAEDIFKKYVIEPFRKDYQKGYTPSPCVDCNEKIKFGYIWDFIEENFGITHLATGHYAKIYENQEGWHLARGRDKNRDQSYFLYGIKAEKLPYLHFPLEPYTKAQVREIAENHGMKIADKPDSMELCFAGEGDYRSALSKVSAPGYIIDTSGKILKEHKGIENYTIGQRKGLGVSAPYPLYVTEINIKENTVTLGKKEEGMTDTVTIHNLNIIEYNKAKNGYECYGKVRSNGDPKKCRILSIDENTAQIQFEEPFFRVAPGQKTVLYDKNDNIILGGTNI